MDDLKALRPILYLFALFTVTVATLALLISNGYTEHITPPGDVTAEQFVKALGAHRYEAALDELSEDLGEQVTADDLRDLALSIEAAHGGIGQASGEGVELSADSATARVRASLEDGEEQVLEVPLVRENALWKVAALDPFDRLTE